MSAIGRAIRHAIQSANRKIRRYPAFPGDSPGNQSADNTPFFGDIATFEISGLFEA